MCNRPPRRLSHWHGTADWVIHRLQRSDKWPQEETSPRACRRARHQDARHVCLEKRPSDSKSPVNSPQTPPATSPGAVVAIDQMTSSTQGLIGQMQGFLTRQRHTVTTAFVDQCTVVRAFSKVNISSGDSRGKESFQKTCKETWSHSEPSSCRQRYFCRSRVRQGASGRWSNDQLLCSQCASSKR
jgi:hypothetical protein